MTDVARFSPSRVLAVALIGVGLLASSPAHAQATATTTMAESFFRQGQEKMAAGDYNAASDLFTRALKLDFTLGTLLNLAVCHEKQGKIATAWAEFSDVQARATRDNDTRRAEFARTHAVALEKSLHKIVIEVMTPAPGMRVSLDGTDLPREALGTALPLDPGEHHIDVVAEGRVPFVRKINLGPSGGTDRIEVTLDPVVVATSTSTPPVKLVTLPPPAAPSGNGQRIAGWIGIGLGAAGLGTAIAFGAQMASNTSRRDDLCPPGMPCASQAAFSADHTARVDRLWMFVSGGIGLAALGAGVGLVVASRRKPLTTSNVEVTPWMSTTSAGLSAHGVF
ncbi:Hypothetical protein A7982_11328 [Minicystis rosea]|nr:Hypothetical protein A7982_11328 [Minicystis rosea]